MSNEDLQTKKILGCGDGPSSFNQEITKLNGNITSIEPILDILEDKGFETKIVKTNYEFQKGANKLLEIKVN